MILRELITKLGFQVNDKPLTNLDNRIEGLKSNLKKFAAIAGGAFSVYGIYRLISATATYGDEIAKLSHATGIASGTLQFLNYVAQRSGTSLHSLTTGFRTLSVSLYEARTGSKEYIDNFKRLGISTEDLKNKNISLENIFFKVAERIKGLSSDTERIAIAQKLFGRGGIELLKIFNSQTEGLKSLFDNYKKLGVELLPQTIKESEDFKDSLLDLKTSFAAIRNSIVAQILPSLNKFLKRLILITISLRKVVTKEVVGIITSFFKIINLVGKSFYYLFQSLKNIFGGFIKLEGILKILKPLIISLFAAFSVISIISIIKMVSNLASSLFILATAGFRVAFALAAAHAPLLLWISLFSSIYLLIDDIVAAWKGAESLFSNIKWLNKVADALAPIASFFMPKAKAIVTPIQRQIEVAATPIQKSTDIKWLNKVADALAPIASFFMPKAKAIVTPIQRQIEVVATPIQKSTEVIKEITKPQVLMPPQKTPEITINSNPIINVNGAENPEKIANTIMEKMKELENTQFRQAANVIRTKIIE